MVRTTLVCALLAAAIAAGPAARAEDWPQVQGNAGHTGYTADQPQPPFEVKWAVNFDEPLHTGQPPIVADGKVFVGTNYGGLLALDRNTGEQLWRYAADAPIPSSPAWHDGVVYAAGMDRRLHAVRSSDGQGLWTFEIQAGFWAGPVVAEDKVFVAGRDGYAYAIDFDGNEIWRTDVNEMVMATPAYHNGVLYVGAGDNRIYALDAGDGSIQWVSDPIAGMAIRDYWLVATDEAVICTTQMVSHAHSGYEDIEQEILKPFRVANEGQLLVQDELLEDIQQWMQDHPEDRTYHFLDPATGQVKFVPPIISVHGAGCAPHLPTVGPDGIAHLVYCNVRCGASGWAFAGALDLNTGQIEPLITDRYAVSDNHWEWQEAYEGAMDRHSMFAVGFCVNDQSWGVTRGGEMLYIHRDPGWAGGEHGRTYIDLITGEDAWIGGFRPTGDINRSGRFGNSMHATAAPMAISDNQMFHKIVRNSIICFEGQ